MALPIDIPTIVSYGNICSYLAANDFSRQKMLKGSYFNSDLPRMLDIATDLVSWAYDQNPNDTSLISTGNYLYQLCGRYIAEAQLIIGSGGSGTIINPATGIVSTIQEVLLQFIVGITSSPVSVNGVNVTLPTNGESQIVMPVPNILNNSITVIKDNSPLPIGLGDRDSFAPIYTTPSVTINFNDPLANGDLIVIQGLQYVSV